MATRNRILSGLLLALIAVSVGCFPADAADTAAKEVGYYIVRIVDASCGCPLSGPAAVYFDGVYVGEIERGRLEIPVNITDGPFWQFTVDMEDFKTYTGPIPNTPAANSSVTITGEMEPLPPENDPARYRIRCPVEGAAVFFDGEHIGSITGGELVVDYEAGSDPHTAFSVEAVGYEPVSGIIPGTPPRPGETIELVVEMDPLSTPTPAPSPLPLTFGILALGAAVALRMKKR